VFRAEQKALRRQQYEAEQRRALEAQQDAQVKETEHSGSKHFYSHFH
jgi:hypothetical protein